MVDPDRLCATEGRLQPLDPVAVPLERRDRCLIDPRLDLQRGVEPEHAGRVEGALEIHAALKHPEEDMGVSRSLICPPMTRKASGRDRCASPFQG
jgi:hypothetical protein